MIIRVGAQLNRYLKTMFKFGYLTYGKTLFFLRYTYYITFVKLYLYTSVIILKVITLASDYRLQLIYLEKVSKIYISV